MSKKSIIIVVIILAVVVFGLLIYNRSAPSPSESSPTPTSSPETAVTTESPAAETPGSTTSPSPTAKAASIKEFTVTGKSFSFSPSNITVKKGDRVKIIFKDVGGFHDFKLDEFNVATKRLNTGQEETVEFTADKAGTFEYYCSVGTHRAMGMKGSLVVE